MDGRGHQQHPSTTLRRRERSSSSMRRRRRREGGVVSEGEEGKGCSCSTNALPHFPPLLFLQKQSAGFVLLTNRIHLSPLVFLFLNETTLSCDPRPTEYLKMELLQTPLG